MKLKTKVGDRVRPCYNAGELDPRLPAIKWRDFYLVTKVHKDGTISLLDFGGFIRKPVRSWIRVTPKLVTLWEYQ